MRAFLNFLSSLLINDYSTSLFLRFVYLCSEPQSRELNTHDVYASLNISNQRILLSNLTNSDPLTVNEERIRVLWLKFTIIANIYAAPSMETKVRALV